MKICLPVDQLNGLGSEIFPNFRSAPALLVVDSETGGCLGYEVTSSACSTIPRDIDAIVMAGGMGRGMFNGLRSTGIRVFGTTAFTVAEALTQLASGQLEEVTEVASCGGAHGHGHSHAHAQGHDCGCSSTESTVSSGCCGGHH